MEGAVLYVALVKVFDVHHLKYVLTFTVISYGQSLSLPLSCGPPLSLSLRCSSAVHVAVCPSWPGSH